MAHMITAEDAMAFVGQAPWHFAETRERSHGMQEGQSIETWGKTVFPWHVERNPVWFSRDGVFYSSPKHKMLVRNDTGAVFACVSDGYEPVQPRELLAFFNDTAEKFNLHLETAGSVRGGRRIWALAANKNEIKIGRVDIIKPYLLLCTAFDKTQATHAKFTTVRVVCNNTIEAAMSEKDANEVIIPHSTKFDADKVKVSMGLMEETFEEFEVKANKLAESPMSEEHAREWVQKWFGHFNEEDELTAHSKAKIENILTLVKHAPGQDLPTARGTAWGLLNGITNFVDFHQRARNADNRLDSAWFGWGANKKLRIAQDLLESVS